MKVGPIRDEFSNELLELLPPDEKIAGLKAHLRDRLSDY